MSQVLTDTSDMLGVHQVFRGGFAAAPELVGAVGADDRHRQELVGSYYANLLAFLHCHHQGEDDLIWPRLMERSPADRELVERLEGQHRSIVSAVSEAEARLQAWRSAATPATATALSDALVHLGDELGAHLDEEEAYGLPLVAAHVSAEEYGELPGHALRAFEGDKVWLVLGLIRENMTEEQKAEMLAKMPPQVVSMWTTVGQDSFTAFVAELRG